MRQVKSLLKDSSNSGMFHQGYAPPKRFKTTVAEQFNIQVQAIMQHPLREVTVFTTSIIANHLYSDNVGMMSL